MCGYVWGVCRMYTYAASSPPSPSYSSFSSLSSQSQQSSQLLQIAQTFAISPQERHSSIIYATRFRRLLLKTALPLGARGEVNLRTFRARCANPFALRIARRKAFGFVTRIRRFLTTTPVFFEMWKPRMPPIAVIAGCRASAASALPPSTPMIPAAPAAESTGCFAIAAVPLFTIAPIAPIDPSLAMPAAAGAALSGIPMYDFPALTMPLPILPMTEKRPGSPR